MAHTPTFEQILVEVHQSLGLERRQTTTLNEFSGLASSLSKHQELAEALLTEIFTALEMDKQAQEHALENIMEWMGFDEALAAGIWTGSASEQQVVWHMLAYSYVPGLARRLAFWSLAGVQRGIPFDAGMPGGSFWFLPTWDPDNKTIKLPVAQVLDWLIDLLGNQSLEDAVNGLERESGGRRNRHALRTLQGWRLEGKLPQSARLIDEVFHDGAQLDFRGSYQVPALPADEQFASALAFVQCKSLSPETLADQIPMNAIRLRNILDGAASQEEKGEFVRQLSIRFAHPPMRTVRQRLRVARMMQDGYERLLKFLCGPAALAQPADPSNNKLLQLLALFQTVYNFTIQAAANGESNEDQDKWFESRFGRWDKEDLLLSIMPSAHETAYLRLGERLTRRFMELRPGDPLPDLVPLAGQDPAAVLAGRMRSLKQEVEETKRTAELRSRMLRSSPWRALQEEQSYMVVSQVAQNRELPMKMRAMAIARLPELAQTPTQSAGALVAELDALLNCRRSDRPTDIRQEAESLLAELEKSPACEEWKAPFLRLRAKHRLLQNDFGEACKDFRTALRACSERNYGALRFTIAEEGLATEIAKGGFIPSKQELYYRHLARAPWITEGWNSFEDAAVSCENFFWDALYEPYPDVEARQSPLTDELETIMFQSLALVASADFDALKSLLQRHEKKLRVARMKDARRDSLLLLWMKGSSAVPFREGLRKAIRLLVELWPEQAKIPDFKGQTPLMLAADEGDFEMTGLLCRLSDANAQDYRGRTALHAAVCGGSRDCVAAILDLNPDVEAVTFDEGQTALHTAVRLGNREAVPLILHAFPCRAEKKNLVGETPLEMAENLLANLDAWRQFMRRQNRRVGSTEDFREIVSLLRSSS